MKIQLPNDIKTIKAAVDTGHTVYQGNTAYEVRKDSLERYNIVCAHNDYCIGLHGLEGGRFEHKLNGSDFYIEIHDDDVESFVQSYQVTAIWSSNDTESDTPEKYHLTDDSELAEETQNTMRTECQAFLKTAAHLIWGDQWAMAGHDFWLTRCGHGAGFWDGDWPVHGDELTTLSTAAGNVDLYVGDDGLVYQ